MAAAFVRVAMTECTPGSAGDYYDVDANDYSVPAGATGVWVRCDNNYAASYSWDVRKNGSTDTFGYLDIYDGCHTQASIGIDANGVFEAKVEHTTRLDLYVMGYMTSPVTMRTGALDVSTATTGSYVDVDISASCAGATMALLSTVASAEYAGYTRKNGSTDDRYADGDVDDARTRGQLVGLDGSQVFEQKIENAAVDLYVQGYYAGSKVTMRTNATGRSTATTGSYEDVAALAAGALCGFYEIVNTSLSSGYSYALRKNGEAEDPYGDTRDDTRGCWIVECDANRVIEQKIENAAVDLWELGYAIAEATQYLKELASGVDVAGTVARASTFLKAILGGADVAGAVVRSTGKLLSGVATVAGAVSRARTTLKALAGAVKASGSVVRMAGKLVSASVTAAGAIAYGLAYEKALAAAVSIAASMVRVRGKTLAAAVSAGASVARSVGKILAAGATVGASVKRDVAKGITAAVDVGATIIRSTLKLLSTGVDVSAAADRAMAYVKTLAASVVAGVTIGRAIARTLRADVDVSGTKRVAVSRTLTTMVLASGHVYFGWFVTLTAGVVAWVDIIFGGIPVKLTATVKAGSSIVRSVGKNIVGLVKAAGSVTTFLYDAAYALNRTVRRIFGRVRITYTDPFFSAGVTAESNGTGRYTYPIQTADNVEETAYKWFSLHRNVLDGSFHPMPGDQSTSVGWWGVELSDPVTAEFTTPPVLTVEFAERSILSLVVVGDDKLDEYPADFDVDVYGAADVLLHHEAVTGNTDVRWTATVDPFAEDAVKQVLTIYKWSRVGAVSKIAQFFTMLEETYEGEDLVGIRLYEQREYAGASIPQGNIAAAEITVRLNNIDGTFSPGNTSSRLYEMMLNNRAIAAWLGVELYPSGVVRWYPLGVFYSRDWSAPDDQVWAEVTGLDMLDRLRTTTFSTSEVYEGKSLADLAEIILLDAGLTSADWIIDANLDTFIVPYAWFEPQSHREALRKIAQAGLGQIYVDREGKVVVEIYQEPAAISFEYHRGNVWGIDHPLKWSEMVNRLEVRSSPRMASAEEEIVGDEEEFSINPGASVTKTHFYTFSPCVDVQEPTIEGGADITVAAWTAYAWGVNVTYTNAGVGVESVTRVSVMGKPLDVVPGRVIVQEDAASIAQNGVQSLGELLTSEFWQDEATAQTVATVLLATYKNPRRDIAIRARGNIGQILGDTVQAPDSLVGTGVDRLFSVLSQDINWDGGLQVVLEARAQGGTVRYHKTLTAHATAGASITSRAAHRLKTLTAHVKASGTVHRLASIVKTLFSLAGDGQIERYYESTYLGDLKTYCDDWPTGDSVATGASPLELYVYSTYFSGKNRKTIRRGYVYFGTTVVPSHAVVSDAKLHLYVSHLVDLPSEHRWCSPLYVSDGQPTYPTESSGNPALNVIDYGDEKYTTRTSIARDDIMVGAYNVFDVLSWIRKAALTKFRLTQTKDAGSDYAALYYRVHSSEGTYPPKLVLTYTIEEGG